MPAVTEAPTVQSASQGNKNCWGCRLISGGGLMAAGAYVFNAARGAMRHGGPKSFGTMAQIVFAAGLATWGVVIITDPAGKMQKKA